MNGPSGEEAIANYAYSPCIVCDCLVTLLYHPPSSLQQGHFLLFNKLHLKQLIPILPCKKYTTSGFVIGDTI